MPKNPKMFQQAWKEFKTEVSAISSEHDAKDASRNGDFINAKYSFIDAARKRRDLGDEHSARLDMEQSRHMSTLSSTQARSSTLPQPYSRSDGRNCCC